MSRDRKEAPEGGKERNRERAARWIDWQRTQGGKTLEQEEGWRRNEGGSEVKGDGKRERERGEGQRR